MIRSVLDKKKAEALETLDKEYQKILESKKNELDNIKRKALKELSK
ncbi:hypothetical protein DFR86_08640 [Acidianus sulfidivorans JP7]|uniref:ATPase n=2 Tax=Acidianus TaxID=12914 RepID=A0A2U9INP7_9CREN|nr:hypothetical protein DFR86_08640 [Acidianus sulfidivorans JP7]